MNATNIWNSWALKLLDLSSINCENIPQVLDKINNEINSIFWETNVIISKISGDQVYLITNEWRRIWPFHSFFSMSHLFPNNPLLTSIQLWDEEVFVSDQNTFISKDWELIWPLLLDPQDQSTIWKKNINNEEVFVTQKHWEYLRVMKRNWEVLWRYKNDDWETLSQKWSIIIGNTKCSWWDITYEKWEHKIALVSEENISLWTYALDASDFLLKSITVWNQIRYCARTSWDYIWLRDENNQEIWPFMRKTMSFADIWKTVTAKDNKTLWSFNVNDKPLFVSSAEYPFVNLIKNTWEIRWKVMVDPEDNSKLWTKMMWDQKVYVSKIEGDRYVLLDNAWKELWTYRCNPQDDSKIWSFMIWDQMNYVIDADEKYVTLDIKNFWWVNFIRDSNNPEQILTKTMWDKKVFVFNNYNSQKDTYLNKLIGLLAKEDINNNKNDFIYAFDSEWNTPFWPLILDPQDPTKIWVESKNWMFNESIMNPIIWESKEKWLLSNVYYTMRCPHTVEVCFITVPGLTKVSNEPLDYKDYLFFDTSD
jgi:hypothetical protein